ncbi:MAG: hypothetical protein ACTSVE_09030, partial [Candidatus Helarchaeota archaeon]
MSLGNNIETTYKLFMINFTISVISLVLSIYSADAIALQSLTLMISTTELTNLLVLMAIVQSIASLITIITYVINLIILNNLKELEEIHLGGEKHFLRTRKYYKFSIVAGIL